MITNQITLETIVDTVKDYALEIQNGRKPADIVNHMNSEIIELAQEAAKAAFGGEAGDDGVVGEAIDVMNCALDRWIHERPDAVSTEVMTSMIHRERREIRDEDLLQIMMATIVDEDTHLDDGIGTDQRMAKIAAACVEMIAIDRPGILWPEIQDLMVAKLEKWKTHYANSVHRVR